MKSSNNHNNNNDNSNNPRIYRDQEYNKVMMMIYS